MNEIGKIEHYNFFRIIEIRIKINVSLFPRIIILAHN